ncbi:MAG: ATP-dependent helicase [Candidatus Dormibacteria bacterium]
MTLTLDDRQRQAIDHGAGPCLVLAGPGSGKTRVIVQRFLRLIAAGTPGDRQVVLTYTRKAAVEMRERVESTIGPLPDDPPLTNYHSFAQQVLRRWAWRLGISPAFRIADPAERWLEVDAILSELRPITLHNPLRPQDLVDGILDLIGQAKQELVTPPQYARWAEQRTEECRDEAERFLLRRHVECAEVYRQLEERYKRRGILDHDDTILHAHTLLSEYPDVRAAVCDPVEMVMVDEYQDTNYAQARLVEALVRDNGNLLVVADDDQSIYKFRGASLANLDRFARLYPDHVRVVLSNNYRSTSQIVAVSRAVITAAQPESRIDKHLVAKHGTGASVEVWRGDDDRSEMRAVATECRRLIGLGTSAGDIAWLFRRHDDMRGAIRALQEAGVPHLVHGGRGFFQQRDVKDVIALLSAVLDPNDSQSLLRCLNLPHYAVGNPGRLALSRAAVENDMPLASVIAAGGGDLDAADSAAAKRCVETLVKLHGRVTRDDVRDLFYAVLEESRFLGALEDMESAAAAQIGANLNRLGELLETFADWSDDRSLARALRYLSVLRACGGADEVPRAEVGSTGLTLITAHSAKGLEWPVVIMSRCIESRWPGTPGAASRLGLPDDLVPDTPPPGDGHRDEERRLFYVALSRARDRLILTSARRYSHSWQDERVTPFLEPLDHLEGAVTKRALPPGGPPQTLRPAEMLGVPPVRVRASISDLVAFKDCPRRYAYRAVYHLPVPESLQRWYGVLVHDVLQSAATQRRSGLDVGGDAVIALWREAWDTARGPKGAGADLSALGESQLSRYAASSAWYSRRIVGVEEPFVIDVDSADISGRYDRLDDGEQAPIVVDYKTGPPRTEAEAKRDLQVRGYALAMARRTRAERVTVELHWLQTAEVTSVTFDRSGLGTASGHIDGAARELAAAAQDRDFPTKPSAWKCRNCDYRTICDEGRNAGGS